jgi:hypothetical protein
LNGRPGTSHDLPGGGAQALGAPQLPCRRVRLDIEQDEFGARHCVRDIHGPVESHGGFHATIDNDKEAGHWLFGFFLELAGFGASSVAL